MTSLKILTQLLSVYFLWSMVMTCLQPLLRSSRRASWCGSSAAYIYTHSSVFLYIWYSAFSLHSLQILMTPSRNTNRMGFLKRIYKNFWRDVVAQTSVRKDPQLSCPASAVWGGKEVMTTWHLSAKILQRTIKFQVSLTNVTIHMDPNSSDPCFQKYFKNTDLFHCGVGKGTVRWLTWN